MSLANELNTAKREGPARLKEKREEISATESELDQVKKAPAALNEVVPLVNARIDEVAAQSLKQLFQLKDHSTDEIELHLAQFTTDQLLNVIFLGLREHVKKAIAVELAATWPTDALTANDRNARCNALNGKLQKLRAEEQTIIRELKSIGVEVGPRVTVERR